uniref:Uncharacterized protein n=1 Tax=Aegilops tauschii subsp. strangulata TaxID=200361 RepID=A0A453SSK6_AEGTS
FFPGSTDLSLSLLVGLLGGLGGLLGRLALLGLLLRRPLGQQHRVDVGQHAAVRDGHASQQPPELLVVPDGEQQVPGHDAGLLVVLGGVPGELQQLGGEVLQDGGEVDGAARADALRVAAILEVAPDAADGELEPGLDGPRHRLLPGAAGLAPGRALLRLRSRSGG